MTERIPDTKAGYQNLRARLAELEAENERLRRTAAKLAEEICKMAEGITNGKADR